eukprot:NODE_7754_length_423_cov_0.913043.p1 GENE.NODE_7754_length_423_cov_0.913043~~NODE_7754_length_423_cov_0.913043.p1  ORF type:complete len:111 (-),score=21.34 NODE_7754_length_423_cov_0.913043:90-422(-)
MMMMIMMTMMMMMMLMMMTTMTDDAEDDDDGSGDGDGDDDGDNDDDDLMIAAGPRRPPVQTGRLRHAARSPKPLGSKLGLARHFDLQPLPALSISHHTDTTNGAPTHTRA